MILTTVGTEPYPFNRLMTWLDILLKRGLIHEEVVVQYGYCTVWPSPQEYSEEEKPGVKTDQPVIRSFPDISQGTLDQWSSQARIMISHCDPKTLWWLDQTNKPYILVPRAECYKEYADDRQIELGYALALAGVPIAWSPGDLVRFLQSPRRISRSTLLTVADESLKRSLKKVG